MPHDDALVVTLTVANHGIHRILVDNGSSADILSFQQMGIDRERIKPFASPLVGFGGEVVFPIGIIPLPVTAGTAPQLAMVMVDFVVIDRPSAYNAIMGQPALNKLKVATSTYHFMMKSPTEEGVGVVRGDQLAARKCYNTSMKKVSDSTTLTVASVHEAKGEPAEPLEEVSIGDGRALQIGTCLEKEVREDLVKFLHSNVEVFAEHKPWCQASKAKKKEVCTRKGRSDKGGGREAPEGSIHRRCSLPGMVGQCRLGKKI
jgi:hypothetical protein